MLAVKILASLVIFVLISSLIGCSERKEGHDTNHIDEEHTEVSMYDAELANRLGADDYGMKIYVLALLKSGPNRPTDSTEIADLQRAHLDNIVRLAEEGKLIMAGPMMGNSDLKGIYVFDVRTVEEAKKLTESDPAIQHGSLVMELHEWYSSAAVMQIPEIHEKVVKLNP